MNVKTIEREIYITIRHMTVDEFNNLIQDLELDISEFGEYYIHENDYDFFDTFFHEDYVVLLNAVENGEYSIKDDFVVFDEVENLVTYNKLTIQNYIAESAEYLADDIGYQIKENNKAIISVYINHSLFE